MTATDQEKVKEMENSKEKEEIYSSSLFVVSFVFSTFSHFLLDSEELGGKTTRYVDGAIAIHVFSCYLVSSP